MKNMVEASENQQQIDAFSKLSARKQELKYSCKVKQVRAANYGLEGNLGSCLHCEYGVKALESQPTSRYCKLC